MSGRRWLGVAPRGNVDALLHRAVQGGLGVRCRYLRAGADDGMDMARLWSSSRWPRRAVEGGLSGLYGFPAWPRRLYGGGGRQIWPTWPAPVRRRFQAIRLVAHA